jgi:hypothetical protein
MEHGHHRWQRAGFGFQVACAITAIAGFVGIIQNRTLITGLPKVVFSQPDSVFKDTDTRPGYPVLVFLNDPASRELFLYFDLPGLTNPPSSWNIDSGDHHEAIFRHLYLNNVPTNRVSDIRLVVGQHHQFLWRSLPDEFLWNAPISVLR